ncbi:protein-lysine 6-oxidase [Lucilia sericata]|uniref:protein-lysine 6-oxidase n=1 Tax=Lucilia sericata TaxID=13632 RepID=UPI0018A84C8E|nr:protein-lysine 6-oxidase [Lucilia sericata]
MIVLFLLLALATFQNTQCAYSAIKQPLNVETNYRNMLLRLNNRLDNVSPSIHIREGRVEVSFNYGRTWGTVCATHWSYREANVVCKQLNLGYAAFSNQTQQFGTSHRYPWNMVGTLCRGTEHSLRDCFRESQYPRACNATNRNVAVVRCVEKLSDLTLGIQDIEQSAYLDTQPLQRLTCAMEENCLSRDAYRIILTQPQALRKLLRFTTRAENVGSADFSPYANYEQWQWHQCHNHYHSMESFASFDIYNMSYQKVAQGHKASFCLMDTACKSGITPKYTCGNRTQGISIGCWDTYSTGLDCQWVDVTNLPTNRTYILRIAINPEYMIGEVSFENNGAECLLHYTGERNTTRVTNCTRSPLWYNK